jgi:hypothetical protein
VGASGVCPDKPLTGSNPTHGPRTTHELEILTGVAERLMSESGLNGTLNLVLVVVLGVGVCFLPASQSLLPNRTKQLRESSLIILPLPVLVSLICTCKQINTR